MIATIWAILATCVSVAVYWLMRRENRALDELGFGQYQRAEKLAGELAKVTQQRDEWSRAAIAESVRLIDAEERLRQIKKQRSDTTRRGNLTRAANKRAAVIAKAHEVAPQVERRAA